ncbi:MAG: tetratricopeptide repeat protein [Pyrinomonadaceae bacterium]
MAKKKQAKVETSAPIFQQNPVAQRIEELGKNLEGKGNLILYVLGGILGLAILGAIIYSWQSRQAGEAQAALGKAIETSEAQVSASPVPNSPAPVFATDKERTEKSIAAFENVANKYGSPYKEKAQYFIAVNKLKVNREAGLQELEGLSNNGNREVAGLSKFALAEAHSADGKYDEAAALYNDLAKQQNNVISADTLNYALASVYERQGKKQEAADIYFNLAKAAREAKDADGKPATMTMTAREAARKLEKLDASKFAQLPPESTAANL